METNQQFVDKWLDRAVEDFDRNPRCSQLIRRLAEENPDSFASAAVRHLGGPGNSAALRYLASMMAREKNVFEELSDPAVAVRERSHGALRRIMAADPSFDIKLAKQLPDSTGANHDRALKGARGARAIDLLDRNSSSRFIVPIVSHLVESDDPRLSAGTALFVGRRMRNPDWVERLLQHNDPRVRANAIESLWGVNSATARKLLEAARVDESNRVVGNCFVGLSRIRGTDVADEVIRMAEDPNPRFRATAAWAMGMIGQGIFVPPLTALVKDESEAVRRAALRALIALRRDQAAKAPVSNEPTPETVATDEPVDLVLEMPQFNLRLDGSSFATSGRLKS